MMGWIVSSAVIVVLAVFIFVVSAALYRQIVRKPDRSIDYARSPVIFRWNRWDTMTIGLGAYSVLCVFLLFLLLASGITIDNPFVQFFAHQGMVWSIVSFAYFIVRISLILKGIKERWTDDRQ
jgi:4-hydroxybenzoate polyprenyltransferase